ncbi:MAG: GNAT family N-acetyltransferase [Thermoplasmata archaeon]|nr:GNAT family N-acetyltransferase [Thermoplasmata archaeon]
MSSHPLAPTLRITRVKSAGAIRLARAANQLFDEPADRAALTAYLSDRRNIFLLASVNTTPVGFLRATALGQLHTRRPQMFLYEVAVARRFRRLGVGRALVERLLGYCRQQRFEEVFVFTNPANRAAVSLYRGTGAVTETPRDRMFVYRLAKRPRPGRRGASPH